MKFELEVAPISLDLTLGCGQTFRWRANPDGSWSGILNNQIVALKQSGQKIKGEAFPGERNFGEQVFQFLRGHDDIARIQRALRADPVLAHGMKRMKGLRIVKIDEWECLISYVLATYANIPRITKMVDSLAANYGCRIAGGAFSFPDRDQLASATSRDLKKLGLGYRADYVTKICETVGDRTLRSLSKAPYEDLRRRLIELPGVGDKVADCVSLFGFGRLEAFPIDVWMERALARLYKKKGSYNVLRGFASKRFDGYAGYAQEYLYHNERMHARQQKCVFSEE